MSSTGSNYDKFLYHQIKNPWMQRFKTSHPMYWRRARAIQTGITKDYMNNRIMFCYSLLSSLVANHYNNIVHRFASKNRKLYFGNFTVLIKPFRLFKHKLIFQNLNSYNNNCSKNQAHLVVFILFQDTFHTFLTTTFPFI